MAAPVQPSSASPSLRTIAAVGRKPDAQDPVVVRQTAAQFTSELFFAPLLAEVRKFPFGRDVATGGQTESIFGEQLDQRVADAVANANPALIENMVRCIQPQPGQPAPGADRASWVTQKQIQPVSKDQRS